MNQEKIKSKKWPGKDHTFKSLCTMPPFTTLSLDCLTWSEAFLETNRFSCKNCHRLRDWLRLEKSPSTTSFDIFLSIFDDQEEIWSSIFYELELKNKWFLFLPAQRFQATRHSEICHYQSFFIRKVQLGVVLVAQLRDVGYQGRGIFL